LYSVLTVFAFIYELQDRTESRQEVKREQEEAMASEQTSSWDSTRAMQKAVAFY